MTIPTPRPPTVIPGIVPADGGRYVPILEDGAGKRIWTGLACRDRTDAQTAALDAFKERRQAFGLPTPPDDEP